MKRVFTALTLLAGIVPGFCRAADESPKPEPATETVIKLTVSPAAEPTPALRYLLLPPLTDVEPGNPVQGYLRSFAEQHHFYYDPERVKRREELLTGPLSGFTDKDISDYSGGPLTTIDWAARLQTPDWQLLLTMKREGAYTLLPDIQALRDVSRVVETRLRGEISRLKFKEAVRSGQTMFAMSRHAGASPTLIGNLVGIAIAGAACGRLDEFISQPGAPNLYWALAQTPHPLVDITNGLAGERILVAVEFRDLSSDTPMTRAQLERLNKRLDEFWKMEGSGGPGFQEWLRRRLPDKAALDEARRRLTRDGLDAKLLDEFPPVQVILLDELRQFEAERDDAQKLLGLPLPQIDERKLDQPRRDQGLLSKMFLPAYLRALRAQYRLEQRLALLRTLEALRMYAAEHDGQFPKTLGDLSVPAADDPVTGKPFSYEVTEGVARLRGGAPRGMDKEPSLNVRYEIRVRGASERGSTP